MDSLVEVIVPTFVNAHLFWVIPKKDLLLRTAMNKIMRSHRRRSIEDLEEIYKKKMVAVNINDLWARAVLEFINKTDESAKYVCWLPDYGIWRVVSYVFNLPEELEKCPHLAKQASLHNVVNLTTDLVLEEGAYKITLKKTTGDVQGIAKVATDFMENARKIFFSKIAQDEYNLYGDITCLYGEKHTESLTDYLISKDLLDCDANIFKTLDNSRTYIKDKYFKHSPVWHQELDRTEKSNLSKTIFIKHQKPSMEFFSRKFSNSSHWNGVH